jgi:hypothetical protein
MRRSDPSRYPSPKVRSMKSEISAPVVVVAMMAAQNSTAW